jgi:hypothetical protein
VVNHHFSMSDATTHVPLMVRLPGGRGGGRRLDGLVELVDVAPTLVAMAGLPALEGAAGRDLSPALRAEPWTGREFALSEGELRLLTARGRSARLTAEGLRLENPFAAALLAVAPLDGVSLRLEGEQSEVAALRRSLVEHLR